MEEDDILWDHHCLLLCDAFCQDQVSFLVYRGNWDMLTP